MPSARLHLLPSVYFISVSVLRSQLGTAHSEILEIKTHIYETTKDEGEQNRRLAEAEPLFIINRNRITELDARKAETQERLDLAKTDRKAATNRTFADFQTELHRLIENWLRLEIVWNHPAWETDILYIYRKRASIDRWTDEERKL